MGNKNQMLHIALQNVAEAIGPIEVDSKVDTTGRGWKFASLKALVGAIKHCLKEQGLIVSNNSSTRVIEDQFVLDVQTTITHVDSSSSITTCGSSVLDRPSFDQEYGKKITYWRRYNLQLLLNLTFEKDPDDVDGQEESNTVKEFVAPEPQGESEIMIASAIYDLMKTKNKVELAKKYKEITQGNDFKELDKEYKKRFSAGHDIIKEARSQAVEAGK